MIITVKNLGVIKKAEFDTSKKLTVFCGPNSTGKTYLSYVIYALFSNANTNGFNIDLIKNKIGEIFGIADDKDDVFFKNFNIKISDPNEKNNKIAYIFPVERNSIYTFKTELSLNRNILLDRIMEEKNDISRVSDLVAKNARRYPLAIKDNLYIANDLDAVQKNSSELRKFAEELEDKLLHGTVYVNQNGEVYYKTKDGLAMPIVVASSIVKTLASLVLTLKYQANKGDLLIIDEPEMNLHPDNQILLARIFAMIANSGVKLLISTHSDYIIREINNLVMLSGLSENYPKQISKMGYDKSMALDKNDVGAYFFDFNRQKNVEVKPLDVTETGFEVPSIDNAINALNDASEELYYSLNSQKNENK